MACHVAILKRPYARAILAGTKTVESRLTRTARPPFGLIEPGQRVYIKISAGPFVAVARAAKVASYEGLTPPDIERLRRRFQPTVGGDDAYWHLKRDSRFAVFVTLSGVEPTDIGPAYKKVNMRAWHVVDDALDPIREAVVTGGALRNGYVSVDLPVPNASVRTPGRFRLVLPDGAQVVTDYARGKMLRYRGWRRYFRDHQVRPGDPVRFVALGGGRYRVSFPSASGNGAT